MSPLGVMSVKKMHKIIAKNYSSVVEIDIKASDIITTQ